jgi:transcriptional regulator CtsR
LLPRVTEGKGWYTIYKRDGGLSMRIIKAKNYQDMSRKAANVIAAQVILKEDSVLGLDMEFL